MDLTTAISDRYRIERELGRGGMATVYLAEDVRHNRKVAVKVLHPELAAVLGAERFLAEIRVTANLQHSHILPLFDSGQADGQLFYVMPYVEGESLRGLLDRERQLPIDDAVMLTREVADALDYAHRKGVIHRDIKPENILLHDGHALVADFGIALAVTNAGGGRLTQTGLSLGTPQYMSPEQATGERTLDGRTDVYSLGAVTYEMLTGEPPHTGHTVQAIIARVLTETPRSIRSVRPNVAEDVAFAIEHALEKIPADRWHSAREFADAIGGKTGGIGRTSGASPRQGGLARASRRSRLTDPLTLGLAALAIAGMGFGFREWQAREEIPARHTVRFPLALSPGTSFVETAIHSFAISPNGRLIAFIGAGTNGQPQILARKMNEINAAPLAGTEGVTTLFFSPDSKWVGFIASGRLKKISVDEGTVLPLANTPGIYGGGTWSTSNQIILSLANGALFTVSESGGELRKLCRTTNSDRSLVQAMPVALPDGKTVLYTALTTQNNSQAKLAIASLVSGECKALDVSSSSALRLVDDLLFYTTPEGVLMAARFDVGGKKLKGDPMPVLTDIDVNQTSGDAKISLSQDGTLVYASGLSPVQVELADSHGSAERLVSEMLPFSYPRFSPDGQKIAITIASPGERNVWVYDLRAKTSVPLTAQGNGIVNERAEWSPDGRRVLYRSSRGNRAGLWWRAADLSDAESPLLTNEHEDYWEVVMTPDGKGIVYQIDTAGADLMYRRLTGDTAATPIANSPFNETMARVSPDGHWITYVSAESGRDQVMVQPFPGAAGARTQVSINGGREPV
ncbi:MAG TPA: protein kinase, partial [Gemmatimonadaceae bacterium]|nr:protein kinase [Gemmatimonadaceae bacterium]